MKQKNLGLYIHIPFCPSKCPYCDFCSFPNPSVTTMVAYVDELCRRISHISSSYAPYAIDTVYLGGGTPTVLLPDLAEKLMVAIKENFDVLPGAEVTLECNPATVDKERMSHWKSLGVNRLSMGAQSAQSQELKALGRIHTWDNVCQTVEMAACVGIDNINVDFMMGIPHQTKESLADTLQKAIALKPQHISAYCLSLEEGTPYAKRGAEKLGLPTDDTVAEWYMLASDIIKGAGYEHYEISNFCLPGYASQHNLNTWRAGEYLGLGVAAHSHIGMTRFGQSRDMTGFLAGQDITQDAYTMTIREAAEEAVFLGLRLSEGVNLKEIAQRFGLQPPHHFQEKLAKYQHMGLLHCQDERIFLSEAGWLVSNQILADIWEILEEIWV